MRRAAELRLAWIVLGLLFLAAPLPAAENPAPIRLGLCHALSDLAPVLAQAVVSHVKARLVSAGIEVLVASPGLDGRCCAAADCLTTAEGKPLGALVIIEASRTGPAVRLVFSLFSEKEARVVYQDSQEATLAELNSQRSLDEPEKGLIEAVRVLLSPPEPPPKVEAPVAGQGSPISPHSKKPAGEIARAAPATPDRLWAHVTLWSGVALCAFGGAAAALAKEAADNYAESPSPQTWDRSRLWAGMMWAGFGAGAALVATGVALWLRESPQESAAGAFIVAPAGVEGGWVLGWRGRF